MEASEMVGAQQPWSAHDTCISDELIARLYRATEDNVLDLVAVFSARQRANIAMFCYNKFHLRRIGLAIVTTCDLNELIRDWGFVLGRTIFDQAREPPKEPGPLRTQRRPKITLARSACRYHPPLIDLDDVPEPECSAA
jgi:hypothetical protein